MEKNKRIIFCSVAEEFFGDEYTNYDELLCDVDDGEDCTVKEAREQILHELDQSIIRLQEFRKKIQETSITELDNILSNL